MTEQVYFLKAGERVKIGFSTSAPKRLDALRAMAAESEVLGVIDGDIGLEAALHRRLRAIA